jgi:hypothetical protein
MIEFGSTVWKNSRLSKTIDSIPGSHLSEFLRASGAEGYVFVYARR